MYTHIMNLLLLLIIIIDGPGLDGQKPDDSCDPTLSTHLRGGFDAPRPRSRVALRDASSKVFCIRAAFPVCPRLKLRNVNALEHATENKLDNSSKSLLDK